MKIEKFMHWRFVVLGMVNGLFVGICGFLVLTLRIHFENKRIFEQEQFGGSAMHVSMGINWLGFLLLSGFAFTIGTMLVIRFLAHRVTSILLFWQLVGVASVFVGTIIWVIAGFADHLSEAPLSAIYLARLLLDFLEALALVSIVNLFYGLSVQSSVSEFFNKR